MRVIGWAYSSAGEHYIDIVGVTGSIPVTPTIRASQNQSLSCNLNLRYVAPFRFTEPDGFLIEDYGAANPPLIMKLITPRINALIISQTTFARVSLTPDIFFSRSLKRLSMCQLIVKIDATAESA